MSAHTPGPWIWDPEAETVIGACGNAVVYELNCNDADARLIAAAPDLLEALKAMVQIAEMTIGWFPTPAGADGPLIQARAAIAKAEGEQA